jgi:hypothetical protein
MRKTVIVAALLSLAQAASAEGPFGLEMGTPLSLVKVKTKLVPAGERVGQYTTSIVPKPHPAFELYGLVIGTKTGLCKVSANGKDIRTNRFGEGLVRATNDLAEALTSKYGTPNRLDFLNDGSIWDDPEDWMTGLQKDERVLWLLWSDDSGAHLPDGIDSVSLRAHALSTEVGYVRLTYEFTNFDECKAEIEAAQNSAL